MYARRPPDPEPDGHYLETSLHWLISPRLFDHDGTLAGKTVIYRGDSNHQYMIGVRDTLSTGSPMRRDADAILSVIDKYGAVEIEIRR